MTVSANYGLRPLDYSRFDLWGLQQPALPDVDGLQGLDSLLFDQLPDAEKEKLAQFVAAQQCGLGANQTPPGLQQFLQMLHQGEGRANGIQGPDGQPGQSPQDQLNMMVLQLLELLIDYLANFAQQETNKPRMLGDLGGPGGPGGGGNTGGSSPVGGGGSSSAASAPTGAPTSTASLKGNTNAEKAFNYFVGKGLTKEQAAGIVGNLMQESGCDPNSVQKGGPGRGIAQWSEGERWTGVQQLAAAEGKSPNDLGVQLDYMWKELNSTESGSLAAIKNTSTAADAAVAFERAYERAGIPNNEARIAYANGALRDFQTAMA